MLSRREAIASLLGALPENHPLAVLDAEGQEGELKNLNDLLKLLADALEHLRRTSPPIGSVQAFAGEWPPRRTDGKAWTEFEIGWLLCDGRKLGDVETALRREAETFRKRVPADGMLTVLRAVLTPRNGKAPETLPDYRGVFLRGWDDRPAPAGRDPGRLLGSNQKDATRRPDTPFSTDEQGKHNHVDREDAVALLLDPGREIPRFPSGFQMAPAPGKTASVKDPYPISAQGNHRHSVTAGGDAETRPANVAVNYIIKFQ
jgi:hypothetical protein